MDKESEILFEASCPSRSGWCYPIETKVVSLLPNAPSSSSKHIQKHWFSPVRFGKGDQIQSVHSIVQGDWKVQGSPAHNAEVTVEKEMLNCLFNPQITHSAIKSISHIVMPSPKHIPCVQTVRKQQPYEKLYFWCALTFPNP